MKLLFLYVLITTAFATPGLLKVPKVYNAVITSSQNLSPSRAFPVIQPVIHRTAISYVPPFYYTQIRPYFADPLLRYSLPTGDGKIGVAAGNDEVQASSSRLVESTSFGIAKERESATIDAKDNDDSKTSDTKNPARKNEQVQLSFYPNYHSLYYEPYIYTYNGFNPHLVPGTYYINYQPDEPLEPIPATTPKNAGSGHLLPSFHDEKKKMKDDREQIPNVPPPPLPTSKRS